MTQTYLRRRILPRSNHLVSVEKFFSVKVIRTKILVVNFIISIEILIIAHSIPSFGKNNNEINNKLHIKYAYH